MGIDIDELSEEQLIDLNNRIVERLRFMSQARAHHEMLQFRIGELVWFEPDGRGRVEGVVTRYNKKTVAVMTPDGRQWRVSPCYLRRSESNAVEESGNVLQLPKR